MNLLSKLLAHSSAAARSMFRAMPCGMVHSRVVAATCCPQDQRAQYCTTTGVSATSEQIKGELSLRRRRLRIASEMAESMLQKPRPSICRQASPHGTRCSGCQPQAHKCYSHAHSCTHTHTHERVCKATARWQQDGTLAAEPKCKGACLGGQHAVDDGMARGHERALRHGRHGHGRTRRRHGGGGRWEVQDGVV